MNLLEEQNAIFNRCGFLSLNTFSKQQNGEVGSSKLLSSNRNKTKQAETLE